MWQYEVQILVYLKTYFSNFWKNYVGLNHQLFLYKRHMFITLLLCRSNPPNRLTISLSLQVIINDYDNNGYVRFSLWPKKKTSVKPFLHRNTIPFVISSINHSPIIIKYSVILILINNIEHPPGLHGSLIKEYCDFHPVLRWRLKSYQIGHPFRLWDFMSKLFMYNLRPNTVREKTLGP